MERALRGAMLTRRYFGTTKMARYLLALPLAVRGNANVLAFSKMGLCKSSIGGVELEWTAPNPLFIEEVFEEKCYEPSEEFHIGPDFRIIDAGANVGTFTMLAAKLAYKGTVISLEPNRYIYDLLCRNIEINDLRNVTPLNYALGARDAKATFYETDSGGSMISEYSSRARSVELPTISLQTLMDRYGFTEVDLAKIDIEGAEFQVFLGCPALSRIKRIAMEVHENLGEIGSLTKKIEDAGLTVRSVPYRQGLSYLYAVRK
jgi:FkbM family methyltransferase